MSGLHDLLSIGIMERDTNSDVLWTWSYPSISNDIRHVVMRKGKFSENDSIQALETNNFFYQFNKTWHYVHTTEVFDSDNLPKVRKLYLILISKDFHPEKYKCLARIFGKSYCKTGSPVVMLQLYLSVATQGSCSTEENGTFFTKEYIPRMAFSAGSLKSVISTFGLETILIYTALILKKRVAVYHHKVDELLNFVRGLPSLVWHRQNWSIIFPMIDIVKQDLDDLKENGKSHYIIGSTDASIESHFELYDIFVNLAATEISIAPHAKEMFAMSKTHKEIALFMVHLAEDPEVTDLQTTKDISSKTSELINNVRSFGTENEKGEKLVTLEILKERKLAPATENFLFNLAIAENLIAFT